MSELLNIQDCENKTALHAAVATKNIESVKLLLAHSADPHIKSFGGATALHTAVRLCDFEIAAFLLKSFPDLINCKDDNGMTPVKLAETLATDKMFYELTTKLLKNAQRQIEPQSSYKIAYDYLKSIAVYLQ